MSDAKLETPEAYLATVPDAGKEWLRDFWDHMARTHPDLELTMFRQRPMYRFGRSYLDGYVMFTAAARHFSAHAIDFDLVQGTKDAIPRSGGGKGCVSVPYAREDAKPALRDFVDAVVARHRADGTIGQGPG